MDVLNFNMTSWFEWENDMIDRDYHIIFEMEKDYRINKIISVDFLPFNFKSLVREYLKAKIYKKDPETIMKGLFFKVNKRSEKIYSIHTINPFCIKRIVKKIELDNNFIILNHNPFFIRYIKLFRNNKLFFEANDNWAENRSFRKYKKQLLKKYNYIANNSEKIFVVSKNLNETIFSDFNTYIIPNGVNIEFFKNSKKSFRVDNIISEIKNSEFKKSKIIGYCGILKTDRINLSLLEFAIEKNPDKLFLITGPVFDDIKIKNLNNYKNVKLHLSFIKNNEKPYLYSFFDVCLIPHQTGDFIKSMDPMKLYEYLALGKPVVTTKINDKINEFKNLIYIADNKLEFSNYIEKACIEFDNSLKIQRIKAVQNKSWEKEISKMVELMYNS